MYDVSFNLTRTITFLLWFSPVCFLLFRLNMPWIFQIAGREFKIRCDYEFHHRARVHLDIFTFRIVKCNFSFFPTSSHRNLHNNLLLFALRKKGSEKKLFYCFMFGARAERQQYPILLSYSGYTFICIVITNLCPPTTSKVSFFLISNSSSTNAFCFSSFFDLSENFNC